MKILNDWRILLLVSCTLGLAPFFPEPHIWGKLKWIAGGAVGMQQIDWLDALLHGLIPRRVSVFGTLRTTNSKLSALNFS